MNILAFYILMVLIFTVNDSRLESTFNDEDNAEFAQSVLKAGEEYYKLTTSYSQMPVYGKCWKKPLESLQVACGNLTEDVHKVLALTFANCFLMQSRQTPHPCVEPEPSNISKCLEMGMDDRVFATYNNFYIHTHNMCYFLKSQIWQEETKRTVFRLMDASQRVVTNMESQLEIQKKIRQTQEEALHNGMELRKEMDSTITKSRETIQEMLGEFRQSSGRQIAIFDDIAHQIIKLRALFFGELVGVYTALYYFFIVVISYLLTSCKRLEGARLWLYIAFTLSFTIEYFASNWDTEETMRLFSDQAQAIIYDRIWLIRKTTILVAFVVVIICGWRYRDYIDIVCELQKDNLQTRKEILSLIQTIRQESPIRASLTSQPESSPSHDLVNHFESEAIPTTPTRSASPVRSKSFVDELSPLVNQVRSASPYNLRDRSRSPQVTTLVKESPTKFAKLIHQSAQKSKRSSVLVTEQMRAVRSVFKGTSSTVLSSDED